MNSIAYALLSWPFAYLRIVFLRTVRVWYAYDWSSDYLDKKKSQSYQQGCLDLISVYDSWLIEFN